MGYGIAPNMKDEKVVCQRPCQHSDCKAMRDDFIEHANCVICGKPIKAGDKFYYVEQGKQDKVHFLCEITNLERKE